MSQLGQYIGRPLSKYSGAPSVLLGPDASFQGFGGLDDEWNTLQPGLTLFDFRLLRIRGLTSDDAHGAVLEVDQEGGTLSPASAEVESLAVELHGFGRSSAKVPATAQHLLDVLFSSEALDLQVVAFTEEFALAELDEALPDLQALGKGSVVLEHDAFVEFLLVVLSLCHFLSPLLCN